MSKLIYAAIASLDGFIEDASGRFDWSMPDEEVHAFVNDLQRSHGTYLYGRRLYEVMQAWETMDVTGEPPALADFAQLWRAADKIVFSRTLKSPATPRTRIEPIFDPEAIRRLKAESTSHINIGGAELAGEALRAGLVDDIHLILSPVIVGGGKRALPADLRIDLELVSQRRFGNGVVHLHYRTRS